MSATRVSAVDLLAVSLLVLLIGCGSSSTTSTSNNAPAPTNTGSGGSNTPGVVAFAYVGSAPSPSDQRIFGFELKTDGSVSALPNSPYTGPATSVVTSGAAVFALGTSTDNPLASYARASDGSLMQTSSAPVSAHTGRGGTASGGVSLSLDRSGQSLYVGVINADGTENNEYAVYIVGSGTPQFVANTVPNVDTGGRLGFSPNNAFAYTDGCHFADWDVVGEDRTGDGTLTFFDPHAAIPVTGTKGSCPGAYAISAKNFFALAAVDGPTGARVLATYSINSDGTLGLAKKFAIGSMTNGVRALQFDPSGTFLASVEDRGLVMYRMADDGTLTPTGSVTAGTFHELHWDNAGHLFAIDADTLSVFTNNGGTLAPLGIPQAVPSTAGLAVLPF